MSNEELAGRIKAGFDTAASIEQLWQQVKDYIELLARKHTGEAEQDDLMQEGFLALYDAVAGYEEESGCKFLTYATFWIKQRMVRYIQGNSCIRIPVHKAEELREYNRTVNYYRTMHGRKPTRQEVAYCMGVPEETIEELEKAALVKKTSSLEGDFLTEGGEDDISPAYFLKSQNDTENEAIEGIQRAEQRKTVWKVVDTLPTEQKKVILEHYRGNRSLRETGERLGLSYEKAHALESKALRELRRPHNARILKPLFTDAIIYSMGIRGTGVQRFKNTNTSATEWAAMKLYGGGTTAVLKKHGNRNKEEQKIKK